MTNNPSGKRVGGKRRGWFVYFADRVAFLSGRPMAFGIALSVIILWLLSGAFFKYSMGWQMFGGVGPTLITFLMVFLIQNLQYRDTQALHIKLDELIRATEGAHTAVLGVHDLNDTQLKELHDKYKVIAEEAKEIVKAGGDDTGIAQVEMLVEEIVAENAQKK